MNQTHGRKDASRLLNTERTLHIVTWEFWSTFSTDLNFRCFANKHWSLNASLCKGEPGLSAVWSLLLCVPLDPLGPLRNESYVPEGDLFIVEISSLNSNEPTSGPAPNYYSLEVHLGQVLLPELQLFVSNNVVFLRTPCHLIDSWVFT